MKTIFHLVKWPNKVKRVEIEANDLVEAYDKVRDDYPDWSVSMFAPVFVPPKPIDPPPSFFDVPLHLRPLIQDANFGVRLYSCDRNGIRV